MFGTAPKREHKWAIDNFIWRVLKVLKAYFKRQSFKTLLARKHGNNYAFHTVLDGIGNILQEKSTFYVIIQGESEVWIHPVKFSMDKERKMKFV